ncbi:MAG TPA: flagellar hook-associated protein FlgK, partial [Egibacteraceae bacterium]
MSNFASLHTALTGLRASQVGLDTASHNIANANTVGFTRQRVVLTARPAYQSLVGPIGTGVQVSDIARTRDQFLDARVRAASASSANAGTTAELLGKLEDVLAEPENGITVELTELWAAFEDLGLDPSNAGARRQVISSLEALANRINTIDAGWAQLGADTEQRLAVAVDQVNDLLRDVAQLNQDIAATLAREGTPNDLLDARDVAIDELSRMLG